MAPELDPHRMRELLKKNLATSFGLTLVVGLPLAPPILAQLARVRAAVEAQLPGQYQWYASKHLHATVMPLLRGRYREAPPLQLHELPADLNSLADRLDECFSALQPFRTGVCWRWAPTPVTCGDRWPNAWRRWQGLIRRKIWGTGM
jgi:hypothetical protein